MHIISQGESACICVVLGFPPEECDPATASLPETVGATARKSKRGVSSQRNPEEREPPTASLPETERATRKSKKGAR